jgi:prepilin-type N-terminal cleavage/methylation domain-containing protein
MRRRGFTLIELMIVVAIIGILSAIALPRFADLLRKSSEGSGRGNLATMRSSLSVYYANMEGVYPSTLSSITVGGNILAAMPSAVTPRYHPNTVTERDGLLTTADDTSGWVYDNAATDANFGSTVINCTHTDSRGSIWSTY